jgi:hypothetical protein
MVKYKDFQNKFIYFCEENNFRYFDFIKHLFESNYQELKIIAIDLLIEFPKIPIELLISQYKEVNQLEWLIDMLIFTIDGKE